MEHTTVNYLPTEEELARELKREIAEMQMESQLSSMNKSDD